MEGEGRGTQKSPPTFCAEAAQAGTVYCGNVLLEAAATPVHLPAHGALETHLSRVGADVH